MKEIEQNLINSGIIHIAGVDEVGRGPLAGPLAACAAILPQGCGIAVDDSKKLSEKKRELIFDALVAAGTVHSVQFVAAHIIDEIGIKNAVHLAMQAAVNEIAQHAEFLLIDGNDNIPFDIPHKYVIKGDALCGCIGAASILAKVTRDRYMTEMAEKFPLYGFEKHKGYGTAAHIAAIQKYGLCELHRKSFTKAFV